MQTKKMKKTKKTKAKTKISAFMAGVSALALMTACSFHSNPLKTAAPEAAAQFLVSASQFAEKKLHIFNAPGGYYYGECMSGKEKKVFCDKLYEAMVFYAKTTTDFKTVTVNDLTDQGLFFKKLKEDYNRERFNSV